MDPYLVADSLVQRSGNAISEASFEALRRCFHLPYKFSTFEKERVITSEEEFRALFDDAMETAQLDNITACIRTLDTAHLSEPDKIVALHSSHYFSGSLRKGDPVNVLSTITFENNEWRVSVSSYAIHPASLRAKALNGHLRSQENTDARAARVSN